MDLLLRLFDFILECVYETPVCCLVPFSIVNLVGDDGILVITRLTLEQSEKALVSKGHHSAFVNMWVFSLFDLIRNVLDGVYHKQKD
jgi:hypothetical protein